MYKNVNRHKDRHICKYVLAHAHTNFYIKIRVQVNKLQSGKRPVSITKNILCIKASLLLDAGWIRK